MPEPAADPAAALACALGGFTAFESRPHLAVAVSGGADSLALVLLADIWTRAHGGRVTALTVDHALRAESGSEAAQVARFLAARGIEHHILCWQGPKPAAGIQARARAARYALLEGWCGAQGVLHLLTAHTADDQAETLLLRLRHGSTLHGLAGMSALVERPWGRLLRPLLGCRHDDLCAWLRACGADWIEDPGNRDPRFERSRLRAEIAAGQGGPGLYRLAIRLGRLRRADERMMARLLARFVALHAGRARINRDFAALPDRLAAGLLGRVCLAVGGAPRVAAETALARALARLRAGRATTLAGCRLNPGKNGILVRREHSRGRHVPDAGVNVRPERTAAPLGPGPFQLVSPPDGPTYALSDSDSDPGACMLSPPPPTGPAGSRGTQWRGPGQ